MSSFVKFHSEVAAKKLKMPQSIRGQGDPDDGFPIDPKKNPQTW